MYGTDYRVLNSQLASLTNNVAYAVSNLSNGAALLYHTLEKINWAGFYLMKDGKLILGPFQGKTACTVIPIGKGVCGTAAAENRIIRVADVHEFPGHIACDSASESEIVLPVYKEGIIYGVLDIDSPVKNRFSREDEEGLAEFVRLLEKHI